MQLDIFIKSLEYIVLFCRKSNFEKFFGGKDIKNYSLFPQNKKIMIKSLKKYLTLVSSSCLYIWEKYMLVYENFWQYWFVKHAY